MHPPPSRPHKVVSVTDVSKPAGPSGGGGGGGPRLLMLKLTDGKLSCKGVEVRKCEALKEELPPGTKVLVSGAAVRTGVLQLEPKCIQVWVMCVGNVWGECGVGWG